MSNNTTSLTCTPCPNVTSSCLEKPSGFSLTYLFYLGPIGGGGVSDQLAGVLVCLGVLAVIVLLLLLVVVLGCRGNKTDEDEYDRKKSKKRRRRHRDDDDDDASDDHE